MAKVTWYKTSERLPEGNLLQGEIVLAMPSPKVCLYGYYEKDGKTLLGFHDDYYGKIKEYKVTEWSLFPYPDNK